MLTDLLNQAVTCEARNDWIQAAQCYLKALEISPANKDILLNLASCLFNQEQYENALDLYVGCYNHPLQTPEVKKQLLEFVLGAYYQPNAATYQATYENNLRSLKSYEHNFIYDLPKFEELPYLFIPASDDKFYILEKKTGSLSDTFFISADPDNFELSPGECVVVANIFTVNILEQLLQQIEDPDWVNGMKYPLYLLWTETTLKYAFLQTTDYSELIAKGILVFFDQKSGETHFEEFLKDSQALLPHKIIGRGADEDWVVKSINNADGYRLEMEKRLEFELLKQYGKYNREYYQQLFTEPHRPIRILFLTSRFTQVVQYSTRDFMKACRKLGMESEIISEKSCIHRTFPLSVLIKIQEFMPDIIFLINYFKADYEVFPSNLMFITWVQDDINQINSEVAKKFSENDYIFSCLKQWMEEMVIAGFPRERINFLSFPADNGVFYPRTLTPEETAKYGCDIAVCSNLNNNPEKFLEQMKDTYASDKLPESSRKLRILFFDYVHQAFQRLVENGGLIYNQEHCVELLKQCAQQCGLKIDSEFLAYLAKVVFPEYGYSLPRLLCVKALTAAGLNFKLWGKDWELYDKSFAPYAMGWVQHGPELAKVYSATKMVVGTFALYTGHFRLWEALFCGALCLVRHVPPEYDQWNIREFLAEGEGYVFYYDPQDLIAKVNYYACHEAERTEMVKQGQQKALKLFTYDAAVKQCFEFITNDLRPGKKNSA